MNEIRISYARWHSIVQANSSLRLAHVYAGGTSTEENHYEVRCAAGNTAGLVLVTSVSGADETAWAAAHKSVSEECALTQDAIAHVRGVPLVAISDTQLPVYQHRSLPIGARPKVRSWKVTAAAQTLAIKDIWIGGDMLGPLGQCYITGGAYECFTEAVEDSAIHFGLVDRDDVFGYFTVLGLVRSKVNIGTVNGTFEAGETITGGTSGAKTTVLGVDTTKLWVRTYVADGTFEAGETITGGTSGATAVLGDPAFVEGDVLWPDQPVVEDEYIFGLAMREFPSDQGADYLQTGAYLRTMVWNESATDELRLKMSLSYGRK